MLCTRLTAHFSPHGSPGVTVTYTRGGQLLTKILPGRNRIPSREALGLWRVDNNKAWKVYRTRNQFNKLRDDYLRADVVAALPMGNPYFILARVQVGAAASTVGFVLATDWMDQLPKGKHQTLQRGSTSSGHPSRCAEPNLHQV